MDCFKCSREITTRHSKNRWLEMMSSYHRILSIYACLKLWSYHNQYLWYLLAIILFLQKHSKFERMSGCNYSFLLEKGPFIKWMADGCNWNCDQVNVCQGVLCCVNIITQSLKMSRCFTQHHSKQQQIFSIAKFCKYLTASTCSTYLPEKGSVFHVILPKLAIL